MLSCTGTTSRALGASASGGRNGSLVSRLRSSLLISVGIILVTYRSDGILTGVLRIGFVYFASYTYFASTYFPWMPNAGKCAGEEFAAFSGLIILSSYLVLFISFYFATYKKAGKSGRPRRNTGREALIAMKDMDVPGVGKANGTITVNGSIPNGSARTNGVSTGRKGPVTRSRKA